MTFDQILELIAPYVSVSGVLAIFSLVVGVAVKIKNTANKLSNTALLNEEVIAEKVKSVLPEKMSVEIMPLVKSELTKINEAVQDATKLMAEKMTKKLDTLAKAIASMRNLSNEQREELLSIIDDDVKPQVVELAYNVSDDVVKMAEGNSEFKPVID